MGMPVKISDDLVVAARVEAKTSSRTVKGQIEHWASIGRATELLMTHRELLGLKSLHDAFSSAPRREDVRRLLEQVVAGPHERKEVHALIHARGAPVYETDPAYPGLVVQVSGDGTRKIGRIKNRKFVPEESLHR
jgi:hypothetical protein